MVPSYRRRIYEQYATGLGHSQDQSPRLPYFRKLVSQHLTNRDASIFEIGAGSGAFLSYLREQGFQRLSGVDTSLEQVSLARQRHVDVVHGDVLDVMRQLGDASVDVVVALDVIEHLTKSEVLEVLSEVVRVLVPGGRCIIHTVNSDSPFFGSVRYGDFTHELAFNRNSITQVLRTAGFSSIACFEDRPVVHGAKSLARSLIWSAARSVAVIVQAAETGLLSFDRILTQNFLTVATK